MNEIDSIELIRQAKIGTIVPVIKKLRKSYGPVDYFAKLSDYGSKKNSILLESAEVIPKYGEQSIGSSDPCINLKGKGKDFEITALNELGKKFIKSLEGKFDFCDSIHYKKEKISGTLLPKREFVSEEKRLKLPTHMDIIRAVAFHFQPTIKPFPPYAGLFGAISYDFIDQFEDLPKNKKDILDDPDYEFNYLDNLFLMNHKTNETFIIANALIAEEENREEIHEKCIEKISFYEELLTEFPEDPKRFPPIKGKIQSDTSKKEFIEIIEKIKEHISKGDVFQTVVSRTISADFNSEPLEIYRELRKLNPSPYMFYFNNSNNVLLGASPEMYISVSGNAKEKTVQIRPIAGTKPRGKINGKIDLELDSRYETELKLCEKELAEHTMLVDLARNDVAKISIPETRHVIEPFSVEKFSHVQHLVSNVSGKLRPELDALHAYLACMNMGTLTGAPKVKAMELIRKYEKNARGFYGGSILYITPSKDLLSAIVIRAIELKEGKAFVRTGAGIINSSNPEQEFFETEKKAKACIEAIKKAGGVLFENSIH
ncbi:MAG: anthranilate synthase component 1 [Candidatus Diapherotrites archaeon]